jgi:hypothetical protein
MFRLRLSLAFAVLVALVCGQAGWVYWGANRVDDFARHSRLTGDILAELLELSASKQRLRVWAAQQLMDASALPATRNHLLDEMRSGASRLDALAQRYLESWQQIAARDSIAVPAEAHQLVDISKLLDDNIVELRAQLEALRPLGRDGQVSGVWQQVNQVFDTTHGRDLRELVNGAIERQRRAVPIAREATERGLDRLRRQAIMMAALTIAAALALAPYLKAGAAGNLGTDAERAGEAWKTIPELMDAVSASGEFTFPRRGAVVRPQKRAYEWRVNVTQLKDKDGTPTDGTNVRSLTDGELEGRRQIVDYLRFLRSKVLGFEGAYALEIAPQIGIRETRRLIGEYMLTADDVLECVDFEDTIGVNGWPLEMHVAGDVNWIWPPIPESRGYNHLPYRMLLPRRDTAGGVDNLLVAGRCASMTHDGQSAARVTGACFVMGQAAGTAAVLASRHDKSVHDIDVKELQRRLVEQGAFLGRGDAQARSAQR